MLKSTKYFKWHIDTKNVLDSSFFEW
jgi:hypothetical protein